MTWNDFPYAFFVSFCGTFGSCALIAWALVK